jgi:hypothetical protein
MLQLAQTPSGLAAIAKQFSLCKNVLPHEVEHLILWVVNAFGNMAMVYQHTHDTHDTHTV